MSVQSLMKFNDGDGGLREKNTEKYLQNIPLGL